MLRNKNGVIYGHLASKKPAFSRETQRRTCSLCGKRRQCITVNEKPVCAKCANKSVVSEEIQQGRRFHSAEQVRIVDSLVKEIGNGVTPQNVESEIASIMYEEASKDTDLREHVLEIIDSKFFRAYKVFPPAISKLALKENITLRNEANEVQLTNTDNKEVTTKKNN